MDLISILLGLNGAHADYAALLPINLAIPPARPAAEDSWSPDLFPPCISQSLSRPLSPFIVPL
jgi:hypothetical protein